jgi:hypothetical protein
VIHGLRWMVSATDASGKIGPASCSFDERYSLKLVGFETQGLERALEFIRRWNARSPLNAKWLRGATLWG